MTNVGAFYNENEPYAVEWLENLLAAGHIAPGKVDGRSIIDIKPKDLEGVRQAHFFAGAGGWSYALRLAGWPDDAPVWTGSCPCQPFSQAGRRKGFKDERHLWPAWFKLIRKCRPAIILGEQIASPDGLKWLDLVFADLERAGYAVGAADTCAASVGAPHIRQRLYFVAYTAKVGRGQGGPDLGRLAPRSDARNARARPEHAGEPRELGDAGGTRSSLGQRPEDQFGAVRHEGQAVAAPGATSGFWRDAEWWRCRDGRARPAEPGTFPLADGIPGRVGSLRAYGNAIVSEQAATFIRAARSAMIEVQP